MTPTEARKRLDQVRKESEGYDDESAHSSEDQFYADVLSAIAAGSRHAKTLATIALETKTLEFARWYA